MIFNNKKGAALIMLFIVAVLAVVLLSYALIPQVKNSVQTQPATYDFTKVGNSSVAQAITLDYFPVDSSTFTVNESLVNASNYTVNTTTGVVNFTNTANGTGSKSYLIEYDYYTASYLSNAGERALMAVVILAGIIGLIYWLFRGFGLAND
jgi:predicted PurR-regulated permease PerM